MTVIQKRPWERATSDYWLVLLSIGPVGYPLLADNHEGNGACEAMQVGTGRIEILFSPHQVPYCLGRYLFDRLPLVGGYMRRAIPPANDQSFVLGALACLFSVGRAERKEANEDVSLAQSLQIGPNTH